MIAQSPYSGQRAEDWPLVLRQAEQLWEGDLPLSANLANISALLAAYLDRTNWVGFYLWEPARAGLVLGPFQGRPACTRIKIGKGVCGTAIQTRLTQRVADVHQFAGHIACDSASLSEIVIPLFRADTPLGVLDIDSPILSRFDALDQEWLEKLGRWLEANWA